ncbi:MAG: arylesterase [Kiritimatiellia bacterium]|nr:arylesterase [Kiritimatiellia bacterium]
MKVIPSIAVLCLLVLSQGCGSHPRIARLSESSVVVAFGDSLTAGTGAQENEAYPAVLQRLLHCTVINAGIPGELSNAGISRLPRIIDAYKPSLVVLCHGGNDLLQQKDREEIKNNLAQMIQYLKGQNIDIILIGVPEPKLLHQTASLYRDLTDRYNLPYEGKILNKILSDRSLKSDQIHPNAKGYNKLAEAIAELIEKSQAF